MSKIHDDLTQFLEYAKTLSGDEKGEAQVFCDRLFRAFGHEGYKEAGAILEYRIKKGKGTSFADLIWKPRLLIEMKKAGEKKAYSVDSGSSFLSFSASWPACGRSERRRHGQRWLPEGRFHRPSAEANGSPAPAVTIT